MEETIDDLKFESEDPQPGEGPDTSPATAYAYLLQQAVERQLAIIIERLENVERLTGGGGFENPPQSPDLGGGVPGPSDPPSPPGPFLPYLFGMHRAEVILNTAGGRLFDARYIIRPSVALAVMADICNDLLAMGVDYVQNHEDAFIHASEILKQLSTEVAVKDEDKLFARPLYALSLCDTEPLTFPQFSAVLISTWEKFNGNIDYFISHEHTSPFGDLTPGEIIECFARSLRHLAPKSGRGVFCQRAPRGWEAHPWANFTHSVLIQTANELHGVPVAVPPPTNEVPYSAATSPRRW